MGFPPELENCTLLYLVGTSDGANTDPRCFQPSLHTNRPLPAREQWDDDFLLQATSKLKHRTEPSPFIFLTQTLLLALHQAFHLQQGEIKSFIAIIDGKKISDHLISVLDLRKAIEERGFGHFEEQGDEQVEEWLYRGGFEETPSNNPFLGTVACSDIFKLITEDPNVRHMLRLGIIDGEKSATNAWRIFVQQQYTMNNFMGSAIGALALLFCFTPENAEERKELLRTFVSHCIESFAIFCPTPKADKAAVRVTLRTFTNVTSLEDVLTRVFR